MKKESVRQNEASNYINQLEKINSNINIRLDENSIYQSNIEKELNIFKQILNEIVTNFLDKKEFNFLTIIEKKFLIKDRKLILKN